MSNQPRAGILCAGASSWAFHELAERLERACWVPIVREPAAYNYLLAHDDPSAIGPSSWFIPWDAVACAADKRCLAERFSAARVPTPETLLCDTLDDAKGIVRARSDKRWCLKYPVGTGAAGHRLLTEATTWPVSWPFPLVLQEFVPLARPAVFRTYCAGGELFGWIARQHPDASNRDPWVAHVRGAHYVLAGVCPAEARAAATAALEAASLLPSFGCVDLLQHPDGRWLVLEVGTDGVFSCVDRDLGHDELKQEIDRRIATAFWQWIGEQPPWLPGAWRYQRE